MTATDDAPSFIIGRTAYGKPILDRLVTPVTPLPQAIALAYWAFDAAHASVVDVEFPIDVVVLTDGHAREPAVRSRRARAHPRQLARSPARRVGALPTEWSAELLPMSGGGR